MPTNVPTAEEFGVAVKKRIDAYKVACREYVEKKATSNHLDDLTKPTLADAYLNTADGPVKQREAEAYRSQTYRDHITKKNEARKAMDVAFYGVSLEKKRVDLLQSYYSWKREIIRAGG